MILKYLIRNNYGETHFGYHYKIGPLVNRNYEKTLKKINWWKK